MATKVSIRMIGETGGILSIDGVESFEIHIPGETAMVMLPCPKAHSEWSINAQCLRAMALAMDQIEEHVKEKRAGNG